MTIFHGESPNSHGVVETVVAVDIFGTVDMIFVFLRDTLYCSIISIPRPCVISVIIDTAKLPDS